MKKVVKWTLIVVPVLLILVGIIVWLSLDSIVKNQVEKQTAASTNLPAKLDSARLSLGGGTVELNGLEIGSPKGFSTPKMFAMKDLKVAVSYSQLRQDPIHISQIIVEQPHLIIEQQGASINVKAALDGMPKSESSTMKLIIDALEIRDTKVTIKSNLPLVPPETNLTIPSFTMKNIGNADGAQNGAAIKDVLKQVLVTLLAKTGEAQGMPLNLGTWFDASGRSGQGQAPASANPAADEAKKRLDEGLKGLLNGKGK